MNTSYSEEMKPPKELFSREWHEALPLYWDSTSQELVHCRIDETKKKLEDLKTKLRKKIWKTGDYTQDLLLDVSGTVTLLNSRIGVWQITKSFPSNLPHRNITMVYPRDVSPPIELLRWEEVALGGVQREGVCLVMLSPQCVDWLNEISHWIGE